MDVEFGINIPQFHPDDSADLAPLGRFATRAESLGFDSFWTLDGILRDGPFLEALSSLAYVSAVTTKAKLGTAVLIVPIRPPSVVARMAATIDFLSCGRLILGAAMGGNARDYAASGIPMKERVARLTEGITVMRRLWTEEKVNFAGRFWRLEDASVSPRPAREGGIPIWMGGSQLGQEVNERAIRRAARMGDGWLGAGSTATEPHIRGIKKFQEYAKRLGRDVEKLAVAKRAYIHVDPDREKAKRVLGQVLNAFYRRNFDVEGTCIFGSEKECALQLRRLIETGTKTLIFNPVADHFNQAEMLARDVIPSLG